MCQDKRGKLQYVGTLLTCVLLSAWSSVYKCFADADGIVMSALAFITIAGISLALCKRKSLPALERVDVLFLLWMAYRWARMTGPLNFGTMSEDVLCIGIWTYSRMVSVHGSRKYLEWGICLSAAVQVIVVLLQWSGHMLSLHPDFDVTGTFGNPGPLGVSLAMAMAIMMPRMVDKVRNIWHSAPIQEGRLESLPQSNKSERSSMVELINAMLSLFLLLLIFSLFLSDSRAAWLSVIVTVCCMMALDWLKGRTGRICLTMLPLVATVLACVLYFHRPSSADARLQIWKNVTTASFLSPVLGQGYGSFQSTYMDFQSVQLARQPEPDQWNADDVLAPYNEPLGYLYELGLVGVLLFLAFMVSAMERLYVMYRKERASGLFVLVAYLTFSLFSYPSTISCLHVLVVACTASGLGQWKECHSKGLAPLVPVCSVATAVLALFCLCLVPMRIHIQSAFNRLMYSDERDAGMLMYGPPMWLVQHDPHLLSQYTHVLLLCGDSEKAIPMLERQTGYVNTSRLQMDLATAYEDAGDIGLALMHYRKAQVLRPGLIEPVYAQFSIYKASNRNKALSLARECVRIQPKVNNPKTEAMKAEARKYIARSARFPARKDK